MGKWGQLVDIHFHACGVWLICSYVLHTAGNLGFLAVRRAFYKNTTSCMAGNRGQGRKEPLIAKGVLLKGLPFQTTRDDVIVFFKSLVIPIDNIRIIRFMDGEATGLAFVKMEDEEERKRALLMDRNHMGTRYIEVRVSDESELYYLQLRARAGTTRNELYKISGHSGKQGGNQHPIYKHLDTKFAYISGVPRGSQYKEIRTFFAGRLIGRGKIWLIREESNGQFRGDGYVEFANAEECLLGLQNSGGRIGDSVIDVEPCEMEEAEEFSEGNLGHGSGGRDMEYRQSRMGYDGGWDSGGSRGGRHDRDIGSRRGSSDRRVSRSRRRTPSPARRRREVYTATYGNNTLLREDMYGEPIPDGGVPYDSLHPNGSFSSSPYPSSGSHYSGGDLGHHHSDPISSGFGRGTRGPSIDNFISSAYGGHATVARHAPEKHYSSSGGYSDNLRPPSGGGTRPLMSLMDNPSGGGSSVSERRVVRVEGLPYHVSVPQILEFFNGYDLGYDQVRIQCRDDGSPSGKAFITFQSERYARMATQQLNKRYIGDRYVELFLV